MKAKKSLELVKPDDNFEDKIEKTELNEEDVESNSSDNIFEDNPDEFDLIAYKQSINRLEKALNIVRDEFNIDSSYVVKSFNDKGNKCSLCLSNESFEISVLVKYNVEE